MRGGVRRGGGCVRRMKDKRRVEKAREALVSRDHTRRVGMHVMRVSGDGGMVSQKG